MMLAVSLSAGCTTTEKRTATGAAVGAGTGAVVGAIAGGGRGAAIGAAAGGVAGALIGRATSPGDCVYQRKDGSRYVAPCP
jgi:outer membrane lipoprotein SlyB